ncbi:hypothetical protein ES319_A11G251700v1 [Gossypium barbadense]|uniref:DUF3444 domain-containing protein n=1 Tax=Gossypium barbadense TaxID=3634 RepID=A0A5J5TXK0_GOSBA|nr:hypothetical protein ES319_A11G251700v1 [Gossypium barbadense]
MEKLTDSERIELNKSNLRRTIDEIQDQASSVLLLNLQWKDVEKVLDSAQSSVEERRKEVISKEHEMNERANRFEKEIESKEKLVKDQFETLKVKEEELGRQFRDLELGNKFYEERLREVELKQKQLEELKLKEEEFVSKEKAFEERCREFELEKKELERRRKDLEFSVKHCKEVKLMEKSVKDKLREVGVKEKYLEKCMSEYELKEKQFGLKKKRFGEHCVQFEMEERAFKERRRDLEVNIKQYEQLYKRLGVTEKWVQKQLGVIERKEEEFGLRERDLRQRRRDFEFSQNCIQKDLKDLKFKSEQCEETFREAKLMENSLKTRFQELKEKEEQFRLKMNHFEQRSRDFAKETSLEKGSQDLEAKQKHNEECLRKIKLKEKQKEESSGELARKYKLQFEDLEYKVKQHDQRFMELKLKEKLVNDQFEQIKDKEQQLRSKEKHFEQCLKEFELKETCLELRHQEIEAKEKHYDECLRKVELREKEIEEISAEHKRKHEQQSRDLEFNVKKCEERFKDLEAREKKLAEWSKELERNSLASALHPQVKINEAAGSLLAKCSVDHSSPAHLRFCVSMDGKDLQMFLNGRWKEHGLIGNEVAMALKLSGDPAKLVLDAMEGFYPPHLSKGDIDFEGDVARRSCILLLEQLMKLSPEIKPNVRKEAVKLAFDWITKMKVESGHELEVLGFLWLLASFQLGDAFDADELVNFLVFVAQHIQTPELFKVLGLGDKITGFIRTLVEKKQHMEAIRFIYAFEQVNEFPPVPVLKDFINHSKIEAKRIFRKGKKTPEARDEANTKRIADARAVVQCIEDHKLEYEYLPHKVKSLKNLIAFLEKENASRSLTSPEANPALCTAPVTETPSQQDVGVKRPRAFIATEISGAAPVGATTTVSSKKMASKHLKRSKQAMPKEPGTSRNANKNRWGQSVEESDGSWEIGSETETEDTLGQEDWGNNSGLSSKANAGHSPRRSSRKKYHIYDEKLLIDDDACVSSPCKRFKVAAAPKTKEEKVGDHGTKKDSSVGRTVKVGESRGKEEETVKKTHKVSAANSGSESGAENPSPEVVEYPDPQFSDFESQRAESGFAVNQVWALYDPLDGMPRFYARIKKVFNSGFNLRITWLEADPDKENEQNWVDLGLPVSCGYYSHGFTETCVDRLVFSHRIDPIKKFSKCFFVYPKKGETWALFKDWDIKWASNPENRKRSYEYDIVEVVTDFDDVIGVKVAHLGKVKGFISIFRQTARYGVISFYVSSQELYRFSHQVPSFRMSGNEREDVPVGSIELDPAALPTNLDELLDPAEDMQME